MPAPDWEPSALCDTVTRRLTQQFVDVPTETIERCVRSAWVCGLHVGAEVDVVLVESLAEELLAALPSVPAAVRPKLVSGNTSA